MHVQYNIFASFLNSVKYVSLNAGWGSYLLLDVGAVVVTLNSEYLL